MKNGVFKFDYAEPPPIFYKDSERQADRQMKTTVFFIHLFAVAYQRNYNMKEQNLKTSLLAHSHLRLYFTQKYRLIKTNYYICNCVTTCLRF